MSKHPTELRITFIGYFSIVFFIFPNRCSLVDLVRGHHFLCKAVVFITEMLEANPVKHVR